MFLFKKMKDPIEECLFMAKKAPKHDDVPIGAVVACKNQKGDWQIISRAENRVQIDRNPTHHAEIIAINRAVKRKKSKFLSECTLFVSLEPCAMCATASSLARIKSIVFLAEDEKGGGILHNTKVFETDKHLWKPDIVQIKDENSQKSSELLREFFKKLRNNKKKTA